MSQITPNQIDLMKYDFLNEVRYDADCPEIDFFLKESLGKLGTKDFLMLAALMCRKDKPVWMPHIFLGDGATGKTTASTILRVLCGDDRYTSWRCVETTSKRGKKTRMTTMNYSRLNVCDTFRNADIDMGFFGELSKEKSGPIFVFKCHEIPKAIESHKLASQFKIVSFSRSSNISMNDRTQDIITHEEMQGFKKHVIQIGIPALETIYE